MQKAANDNAGPNTPSTADTTARQCPICGKPATIESKPFCSKRCGDVDLHRWLGEGYRVPASPDGASEMDET